MIQAPENYVLVEIEKKFQDEDGGILIDPTWNPEEYATLEGVVISAPVRTSSDNCRTVTGDVKNGDKVFFSYGVVFDYKEQPNNENPVYKNLVIYEGKEYWKVDMGEIFCKVTDKGVEMVTENVLIEPWHPVTSMDFKGIHIQQVYKKETGIVRGINSNINCEIGDKICFEERFVQEYNVFGKIHYIIPLRRVIAKIS